MSVKTPSPSAISMPPMPMDRARFVADFVSGLRNVIQKHDRVNEVRDHVFRFPGAANQHAYEHAQTNLDATIIELADHLYDAFGRTE